jgi:hypothetical protein
MDHRRAVRDHEVTRVFRRQMSGLEVDGASARVRHFVLRTVIVENARLENEPTLLVTFQILDVSEEKGNVRRSREQRRAFTFVHL